MNETLKIVIQAATAEAQKNIGEVKKELEKMADESQKSGKQVDAALRGFAKGAAIAIAAIGAVTTAFVALGEKSLEFQKSYNRLTASFQSSGSTVKQAAQTYKELFRFMGESDTATEAANLLVQLTNDEKNLAEWTNILKGAFAVFPDSLPVEALAEASNETAKTGVVTGNLADALNWLGYSEDLMNEKLAQTTSLSEREALIRQTLNGLYSDAAAAYEITNKTMMDYNESQANLDMSMVAATQRVIPLMTALNNLSATMLNVFAPAIGTVSTYLVAFIQLLTEAFSWVGSLFGILGSDSDIKSYQGSMDSALDSVSTGLKNTEKSAGGAISAIKELKKQTMGFDELNVMTSQDNSASSGGGATAGGGSVSIPQITGGGDIFGFDMEKFKKDVEEAKKKVEGFLVLVGIVGASLLAWKITDGFKAGLDVIKSKLLVIVGYVLIIAGALALVYGFCDAWANGLDWTNFALILGGIAAICVGLALTFGPVAALIGVIAGAIALVVIGVKDLIENGYSLIGVISTAIGVIAILLSFPNPITAIIAAVVALVAVFTILWNECDWFRNFWINLWADIKKAFSKVWEWLKQACKDLGKFFTDAWNVIKKAFSPSAVGAWFKDTFTSAVKNIKSAFGSIGSFFSGIWNDIKRIFSNVGSTIGSAITNTVKTAINGVLSSAVKIINGFIKAINSAITVINAIPSVNIKKLEMLSVPKLAKGGIVNSATLAVIGERGQEAVLPLEGNNAAWMDKLADRISSKNGANKPIYLMVDKKVLGQVTAEGINNITALTGQMPLKLY